MAMIDFRVRRSTSCDPTSTMFSAQGLYIDRREGHVPTFATADGGCKCASLGINGFLGVCARYQGT